MSTAKPFRSKGGDSKPHDPSYFALNLGPSMPGADSPLESPLTGTGEGGLQTPTSKSRRVKFARKAAPSITEKPAAIDGTAHTRLQAKWIDMHFDQRRDSQSSTATSSTGGSSLGPAPVVLDLSRRPSDFSNLSADERKSNASSDDSVFYQARPSGLSHSGIIKSVGLLDASDEEKIAHRPVVAQEVPRLAMPAPSLSRRGSSDRWAERLRRPSSDLLRSSSSQSLSGLASPRSPLAMLPSRIAFESSPFADPADTPSYVGTPTEEMPFTNPWGRRQSKTGRTLDQAINFERIRSPMLSPSVSMPDISKAREIDARPDAQPYANVALRPGMQRNASSASSDASDDDEDEDDDEYGLGPVPQVPAALEYIDPEIRCIAPNASTVTLPQAEARVLEQSITHPWVKAPFNIVDRKQPRINKFTSSFKVAISFGVVSSLLIGYGLGVKIVSIGPWSFGMYGLILVLDFITQTIAASYNRRRVNKLTAASPLVKGVAARLAVKDGLPAPELTALPEASIAVVGYREDEEAWVACLKSLQAQEYPIKHIIGVVDGNEGPDMDMANAFGKAFPEDQRLIVHLPVLLSVMYKEKYAEHLESLGHKPLTRWENFRMWLTQEPRPGQEESHEVAWNYMLNYVHKRAELEHWSDWKGICFSEPHGHKRHAMFTAFIVGAYALGTKDAILTTDSDTFVHADAVKNMMALLFSDEKYAGVTGDVRIWNKNDSFLALMSSIRYWFAFNVERACQSAFGCVGCLSGPLGLYKTSDLISVLGPWIRQTFLGKETTFGDDRHLSNRILALGHKTGYTHLAICDSDTPASYVRWVKQQTRWSKSFFREAFWFPKSFAYQRFWLTVETSKQFLYPFVLTATILRMLYHPTGWIRPLIWLATMFGVALIKSIYGVICLRDPRQFLFGIYGFMYFFGLLPSKLFACFTVHVNNWGTSARSKSEFARPESFLSRTTHVGHLVVWYMAFTMGLSYLLATVFHQPLFYLVGGAGLALCGQIYSDVIAGESKYYYYVLRKKLRSWRASKSTLTDEEKISGKPLRGAFKKLRRGGRSKKAKKQAALNGLVLQVPAAIPGQETADVIFNAPATPAAAPENARAKVPTQLAVEPRHAAVDPLASSPVPVSVPAIIIASEIPEYAAHAVRPQLTDERKASVATTATASSYDSVATPADSVYELGRVGYHPDAITASTGKDKVQANKVYSLASALSKRLGATGIAAARQMESTKDIDNELDAEELEGEDFPFTGGITAVY